MSLNYEKLTWVLTKEGINQIREVLANPDKKLQLTMFKFGDANGTYYIPTGKETNIKNQCLDEYGNLVQFNVNSKTISTVEMTDNDGNIIVDSENNPVQYQAVNISTLIPENSGNFQFLEVGLFGQFTDEYDETHEYLFALSTCSPIPKPSVNDNYVISLTYSASFISSNLLAIYNRISLKTDGQFVSKADMEDLSNVMLFTSGNLIEQVNQNSHILGLNRGSQLEEEIKENKQDVLINAGMLTCNSIKNLVEYNNLEDYWIFKDSGSASSFNAIKNYGYVKNNLNLSKTTGALIPSNIGLAYTLNFGKTDYFQLINNDDFIISANKPFTMSFSLNFNNLNSNNTLLAQRGVFEIKKEHATGYGIRLIFNLYGQNNTSLTCATPYWDGLELKDLSTIMVSYNGNLESPVVNFFINLSCISCNLENGIVKTGNFNTLNTSNDPIASYTLTNNDVLTDFINAKISIITKINNTFLNAGDYISNSLALTMQSIMGQPTCLII